VTELVLQDPKMPGAVLSAATCVFQASVLPAYRTSDVSSVSGLTVIEAKVSPDSYHPGPVLVRRMLESEKTGAAVYLSRSWPEALETGISNAPVLSSEPEPAEAMTQVATLVGDIISSRPVQYPRLERIRSGGRWMHLAMSVFPGMRAMSAEEAAAYRAFVKKISRRVRIVRA